MMILGLIGKAGAGKTTTAQILEEEHGFTHLQFEGDVTPSEMLHLISNNPVPNNIVVSDCTRLSELYALESIGGIIWIIQRELEPSLLIAESGMIHLPLPSYVVEDVPVEDPETLYELVPNFKTLADLQEAIEEELQFHDDPTTSAG